MSEGCVGWEEDNKAIETQLDDSLKHSDVGRRCLLPARNWGKLISRRLKKSPDFPQGSTVELTHCKKTNLQQPLLKVAVLHQAPFQPSSPLLS